MHYLRLYISLVVLISFVALHNSSSLANEICYIISSNSYNVTQCQGPSFYTLVQATTNVPSWDCNGDFGCDIHNRTGTTSILTEEFWIVQPTLDTTKIPKPKRYVEYMRFRDSNCTNLFAIWYYEIDHCSYYGYGTCDEGIPRIRYYNHNYNNDTQLSLCSDPRDDKTFPFPGQCISTGNTSYLVSCGTSDTPNSLTSQSVTLSLPQFTVLLAFVIFFLL